jgi:hypothetical protein
VCATGDTTHIDTIFKFLPHASTWVHRYSSLLQWSVPLGQRGHVAMVGRTQYVPPLPGSYYKKGVWANVLIYAPFIVISLIKTLVAKIHNMHKMYNIDVVNNLQCFDNTLIISRLASCQVLIQVFWSYTIVRNHFVCWFRVVHPGCAYKQQHTINISVWKVHERSNEARKRIIAGYEQYNRRASPTHTNRTVALQMCI